MKQWIAIFGRPEHERGRPAAKEDPTMQSRILVGLLAVCFGCYGLAAQQTTEKAGTITINWEKTVIVSKSTPTDPTPTADPISPMITL